MKAPRASICAFQESVTVVPVSPIDAGVSAQHSEHARGEPRSGSPRARDHLAVEPFVGPAGPFVWPAGPLFGPAGPLFGPAGPIFLLAGRPFFSLPALFPRVPRRGGVGGGPGLHDSAQIPLRGD